MSTAVLTPHGNTVRMQMPSATDKPALLAVLVVNDGRESRRWLDILRRHAGPWLNYYMEAEDLQTVQPHLYPRPTSAPCFLVFVNGWAVDWFPAPESTAGAPPDLMRTVSTFLAGTYGKDLSGASGT